MPSKPSPTAISPAIFRLASLLFFISGGTGLAYQVIWFKRFTHVWGSSSLAFAAVAGSFLFGLGLGAYLFGRFADRLVLPLRWYGLCELAIGMLALVVPSEISTLVDASVRVYAGMPQQTSLRFLVQFGITLLVIGPSCASMGGTLPLLIRQLTTRKGSLDEATGWLYAINTFGAAAGCYLTGFHLLPELGLLWTNILAAGINVTIGAVSLLVSRSIESRMPARARAAPAAESQPPVVWTMALARLYVAVALSGCAALILEMTWSRQLALVLGGSTYAFTATLFVVLIGIALGSLVFHVWLRDRASSPILPIAVIGVLIATTLVGKWLLPWLSTAVSPQSVRELRGDAFWNGMIAAAASSALELIPAVAMGVLFPLFVHLTQASAARVGSAVGNIYAWNTLGSIAGATLTAMLLFPSIGTAGAMAVALGLYLAALLAVLSWSSGPDLLRGGVATAVGALAITLIVRPTDPRLTNLGLYIYGNTAKTSDSSSTPNWASSVRPLYFREGASSNVFVGRGSDHIVGLRVNGKVDATSSGDMVTQLGLAYFPRFFNPDAKEVLVIGYGSGCTSGASLLFPGTRVTCCEIEPAVYAATEHFASYNHRPQEKTRAWLEAHNADLPANERMTPEQIGEEARMSLVFGDGRTAIQGSDRKYDLIISEPSNPWLAGVSNLFTREFFHAVREHLNEGGVLAQWIQAYQFTRSDYLMIARTLRTEFPHYGIFVLGFGVDTVLLASDKPLLPNATQIAALQKIVNESPQLTADFKDWFGGTDLRRPIMLYYHIDEKLLNQLIDADSSHEINTDLHLRLEFDAPLHLFRKLLPRDTANYMLMQPLDAPWMRQLGGSLGVQFDSADYHLACGNYLVKQMSNPLFRTDTQTQGRQFAAAHYRRALSLDPKLAEATRGLERLAERASLLATFRELARMAPEDPSAHALLAIALVKENQAAEAVQQYREALRLEPRVSTEIGSDVWANNLAWILATSPDDTLRDGAEALRWATQACEATEYNQPEWLDGLGAAYAESGKFDEAIQVSERLIALAANKPDLVEQVKARIKLYRLSQPFRDEG